LKKNFFQLFGCFAIKRRSALEWWETTAIVLTVVLNWLADLQYLGSESMIIFEWLWLTNLYVFKISVKMDLESNCEPYHRKFYTFFSIRRFLEFIFFNDAKILRSTIFWAFFNTRSLDKSFDDILKRYKKVNGTIQERQFTIRVKWQRHTLEQ